MNEGLGISWLITRWSAVCHCGLAGFDGFVREHVPRAGTACQRVGFPLALTKLNGDAAALGGGGTEELTNKPRLNRPRWWPRSADVHRLRLTCGPMTEPQLLRGR